MRRGLLRLVSGTAVLAVLLVSGCDIQPTGPQNDAPYLSPQEVLRDKGGDEYTFIEEELPQGTQPVLSQLIGPLGGTLSLADHVLTVPAGAVTEPTVFMLSLPAEGLVEVELRALQEVELLSGLLRMLRWVDVGHLGFREPVQLTLTYRRAKNVDNPRKLFIAHILAGDGGGDDDDVTVVPLRSRVDVDGQTVTAELEHFSRYRMVTN